MLAAEVLQEGNAASLVLQIDSLAPDGTVYLKEIRRHLFHVNPATRARIIDLEITLSSPTDRDASTVKGKKDSGLSLRIAHPLTVDAGQGARIVNSLEDENAKAWGKRAAWVDCNGPVDGRVVGIAILNHPDSFR